MLLACVILTLMEEHEQTRTRQLRRLKDTIDTNIQDPKIRDTFNEVYDTLNIVSTGVDEAHQRLDIRKNEITDLTKKMDAMISLVYSFSKDAKETNSKTKRNSKISMISNLIAVFFSLFLVFGGAEALKQLGLITTAIKAIDIVA